jgi:hypothetical protein
MLVVVSTTFVVLVIWLVAWAIQDLAHDRRVHVRIDVARLVSTAVLVVFSVGVALWIADHPGDESGEAMIFAMVAGLAGALAVFGAEVLTSLSSRGKARQGGSVLPSGGAGGSATA